MINSLASVVGKGSAHEFVGSRVKLCYNQVVGDGFKAAHKMLQQALSEDKIELALIPNGIIPIVDPRLAAQAVNSDRRVTRRRSWRNSDRSRIPCSALPPILCPLCVKALHELVYCQTLPKSAAGLERDSHVRYCWQNNEARLGGTILGRTGTLVEHPG